MATQSGKLAEIGTSGLQTSVGYIDEEVLPDLKGEQARKVLQQMADNDPVIGGYLFAIDKLLRSVEWSVEENPDGSPEDAQFLEECMDDMSHSWSDFISEVLTMLPYGWSFFEIVYKIRDGEQPEMDFDPTTKKRKGRKPSSKYSDRKIGWRKFASRSQTSLVRWEMDEEDLSLLGMVQRTAPKWEEKIIPITKGLLFRTSTHNNNPEGRSILRNAYRPWYFKKRMEEIEGIGVERDLAGLPFAEIDAEILSDAANGDAEATAFVRSIETVIRNIRQDREAGVIWPRLMDAETGQPLATFQLLNSGGARSFDITNIVERYDSRIAMTVLADFILLGHQQVGSFALSSDKTSLFSVALGAWLQGIADVINRFAVHRLFRVNGMSTENLPKIVPKDIEKPDLAALGAFMQILAAIGMPLFPDDALEKYVREIANLPEQSEDAKDAQDAKQAAELSQLLGQLAPGGEMEPGDIGVQEAPDLPLPEEEDEEEIDPEYEDA